MNRTSVNEMIDFVFWPQFINDNCEMVVKVWTLTGTPVSARNSLYNYFQNMDKNTLQLLINPFINTDCKNLGKTEWLNASNLNKQLFRFGVRVAFATFKCIKVFDGDKKLNPEFEMEILLGSDLDNDKEQSSQEIDSDEFIRNDVESVREFQEDV